MEKIMYGFVYAVQEDFVLVRPFFEEELVEISGTDEQIKTIHLALKQREKEQEELPIIVSYNVETRLLNDEEQGVFYGSLAG